MLDSRKDINAFLQWVWLYSPEIGYQPRMHIASIASPAWEHEVSVAIQMQQKHTTVHFPLAKLQQLNAINVLERIGQSVWKQLNNQEKQTTKNLSAIVSGWWKQQEFLLELSFFFLNVPATPTPPQSPLPTPPPPSQWRPTCHHSPRSSFHPFYLFSICPNKCLQALQDPLSPPWWFWGT